MTATIIRTQEAVAGAPMADLVATYQALTGKAVQRFASRVVAERRVIDAIMAAQDATGHLGVSQHATPAVTTVEERVDIAAKKGRDPAEQLPPPGDETPGAESDDTVNPFKPGALAHGLWFASRAAKKIEPRPKAAPRDPAAPKRKPVELVQATFTGKSKPQPGSDRNAVLIHIQSQKNADGTPKPISVEALEEHFQKPCRGFIQKLMEKEHITLVEAQADTEDAA